MSSRANRFTIIWLYRPTCGTEKCKYSGKRNEDVFDAQADFGFVKKIQNTLEPFCQNPEDDTLLTCSKNLEFCQGKNIVMDLREVQDEQRSLKYAMDILKPGQIGAKCQTFDAKKLRDNQEYMSPLQSWAPEFRFFHNFQSKLECDVVVNKTTFVMKLDATVNMYHHFCDFFNLYVTQHVRSHFTKDVFERDVNILIWENQLYQSNFGDAFRAFTANPLLDLNSFGRSRVCFKDIVFTLPPRMVFGLYYNTPLSKECNNSGLFKAFSEFVTHRLHIPKVSETDSSKLKVTIISRRTQHRRILNEMELVSALEKTGKYEVTLAPFTHRTDFLKQMSMVHKTDILVGMHGAGLTHTLFLRDWAALFEIYHCEDSECYGDLARLRGVKYITWTNDDLLKSESEEKTSASHAKFTSYSFDVNEFLRKIEEAADHVKSHPEFQKLDKESKLKDEL